MVNALINAIAKAIKKEFSQCNLYTEQLEQGFESPCFFILCISHKEHDRLAVRFLAEHTFCISYFPQKGKQECWEVQSKLNRLLEQIKLDNGFVRGTNRKGEIHDNVLHFFVDYDFYMRKEKQPDEWMEVLEVYEKTRNKGNTANRKTVYKRKCAKK